VEEEVLRVDWELVVFEPVVAVVEIVPEDALGDEV
jgi:hypothetical protein